MSGDPLQLVTLANRHNPILWCRCTSRGAQSDRIFRKKIKGKNRHKTNIIVVAIQDHHHCVRSVSSSRRQMSSVWRRQRSINLHVAASLNQRNMAGVFDIELHDVQSTDSEESDDAIDCDEVSDRVLFTWLNYWSPLIHQKFDVSSCSWGLWGIIFNVTHL